MARKRVRHHVNPLADQTEHYFAGFANRNPVIIDVGADRGEFTQQLLEQFQNTRNFIVAEIRKPLARRLETQFHNHDNVAVFDGDMVRNFENIVRPSVERGIHVEEIYINFPDPWFKKRHQKRRFLTDDFIHAVKTWMPSDTTWFFQTDEAMLFTQTHQMLRDIAEVDVALFDHPPHGCVTKWEAAKTAAHKPIYRLSFSFHTNTEGENKKHE